MIVKKKINLLKKMGKHKEALKIVLNEKKIDKQFYFDSILRERPDLKNYLIELQNKPKTK